MVNLFTKKRTNALSALLLIATVLVVAQEAHVSAEGDWFYFVKTEPSDPSRETEFNDWYDDIDIPDVLAVPSFKRARRAIGQEVPGFSDVGLREGDGKYAALYDIATPDIDNSIIDLYVAARKMNALGRSTDALRVVEANYYRRLTSHRSKPATPGAKVWFYVQKIICCSSEAESDDFLHWFDSEHVTALSSSPVVVRASLYELYRVMEELAVGGDENPHLLALYEVEARNAEDALAGLERALRDFRYTGRADGPYEIKDSILYAQMSDVRSD